MDRPNTPYVYRAIVGRVVDGDTIDCLVDVGFHMRATLRFRLRGIDAPELHSSDAEQRIAAEEAKIALGRLAPALHEVTLRTFKSDSFGRWIADVWNSDGVLVNLKMIEDKHALPYERGPIPEWYKAG